MTTPVGGAPVAPRVVSERAIVFLVGAVQFVNILDFVIVLPLGPDIAPALGYPVSQQGFVGGSYTAAAAVAGLLGSTFLDRLDRRAALAFAMLGLALGTAAGGLATDLNTLMAARVLAGLFGGPATSLSFSIIADVVPVARRGKAMGAVMAAFSFASVFGVPGSLELAHRLGWRAPFFFVAALGVLVTAAAFALLPPMRAHLDHADSGAPEERLRDNRIVPLSYLMTAVVMMAGFTVIPNISAHVQGNLHYPREQLPIAYLVGGVVSFFAMRAAGRAVDRYGSFPVGGIATIGVGLVLFLGFYRTPSGPPAIVVPVIFATYMLAMGFRNVAYNTLTSRVPRPSQRARFMSFQSAVQHIASSAGAIASAQLLTETPDHRLLGLDRVALLSLGLSAFVPPLLATVERRVRVRADQQALASPLIP